LRNGLQLVRVDLTPGLLGCFARCSLFWRFPFRDHSGDELEHPSVTRPSAFSQALAERRWAELPHQDNSMSIAVVEENARGIATLEHEALLLFAGAAVGLLVGEQNTATEWNVGTLSLTLCTAEHLSADVAAFRAQVFPHVYESARYAEVEDLIDSHSLHIVMGICSKVSGYCRITTSKFLVFSYFTDGLAELPSAADTWSLGRGGVGAEWRRAELLTVVVIEGIRQCRLRGAGHVVGSVPPTDKALKTIQRSLMCPVGPVVPVGYPDQREPTQPVMHACAEYSDSEILKRRDAAVERSLYLLSLRSPPNL
jgi:hypothetical protein